MATSTAVATWDRVDHIWPVELRDASYARFLATRSLMSNWTGDYETCLAMATEAHRLGIDASNLEASVTSACNAGLALVGLSRLEEGISWLDRAIGLGREWEERSFRFTARGMNMRAGALRYTGELEAARVQSQEALELAKDSVPAGRDQRTAGPVYADLMDGDAEPPKRDPRLVDALEEPSSTSSLWSIRLTVARAETARLAGRDDEAIELAHTALAKPVGSAAEVRVLRPDHARTRSSTGRAEEAADVAARAALEAERLGHLPVPMVGARGPHGREGGPRRRRCRADAHGAAVRTIEEYAAYDALARLGPDLGGAAEQLR